MSEQKGEPETQDDGSRRADSSALSDEETAHKVLLRNLPWLATLVLFALLLTKILVVSRFDIDTTLALVNRSGIVGLSLGTFAPGFSLVLYLVWIALFQITSSYERDTLGRTIMASLFMFVGVFLMWVGSWIYIVLVYFNADVLFGGPLARHVLPRLWKPQLSPPELQAEPDRLDLTDIDERMERAKEIASQVDRFYEELAIHRILEENLELLQEREGVLRAVLAKEHESLDKRNRKFRRITVGVLVVAGIGAMIPFLRSNPWFPLERIVLHDDSRHVGYVVQESDGSVVFMSDSSREIEMFESSAVSDRTICRVREGSTNWLLYVFTSPPAALFADDVPDYPLCEPDPSSDETIA